MSDLKYKIVADSSANITHMDGVDFDFASLHIIVGDQDFKDDENVDLAAMQHALDTYKGKTSTSCPSTHEYIEAFGDADVIFCVTITSGLSGSYSSAIASKQIYEEQHPGRIVYVIDSLSTGPEMALLLEKIKELINEGLDHAEIDRLVREYHKRTHLYYSLASLNNLARNGRVNSLLAKGIGLLGIKIVGTTTPEGTLHPEDKKKGEKRAYNCIIEHMEKCGFKSGNRSIITHTGNPEGAEALKQLIIDKFGSFNGYIGTDTALCSYYAEPMSVLIGFES